MATALLLVSDFLAYQYLKFKANYSINKQKNMPYSF